MEKIKIYLIPLSVALLFMSLLLEKQNHETSAKDFKTDSLFVFKQKMNLNIYKELPNSAYKKNLKYTTEDMKVNGRDYSLFFNDSITVKKKYIKIY